MNLSDYIYYNGRLVNMDELMHSATYVGTASGGEYLQHWKYIKKERKNGRWVYYYDKEQLQEDLNELKRNVKTGVKKALGYDRKDVYEKMSKNYKRSWTTLANYNKRMRWASDRETKALSEYKKDPKNIDKYNAYSKAAADYKKYTRLHDKANSEAGVNGYLLRKAASDYKKTPAYHIEKIKKAIGSVADKTADSIQKTKQEASQKIVQTVQKQYEAKKKKARETIAKAEEASKKTNAQARDQRELLKAREELTELEAREQYDIKKLRELFK